MAKSNDQPGGKRLEAAKSEAELFAEAVARGMKRAVKEAIADHHRAGNPVAIWRDGQVVLWYPDGTYRPVEAAAGEPPVTADDAPD